MGIAKRLGLNYNKLSNSAKAELIQYWVSKPGTTMKQLANKFQTNEHTASNIITKNYFGKIGENTSVILLQSKINIPEYELTIID